ncbi:hypothetical protein B0H14DRAFT_2682493 [Mycena olivaceomarginata]|nr:hypothetical protein B0H14DRAFT_2682493 [Mycena olivaceomarginata]
MTSSAACIYVFQKRTDDSPISQLGEVRTCIEDGQLHITFIVGNFYNELVCSKMFQGTGEMGLFTLCPAVPAFQRDVWKLIWRIYTLNDQITAHGSDRSPQAVAQVALQFGKRLVITFFAATPECTRNAVIVGVVGLGSVWTDLGADEYSRKPGNAT